MVKRIRHISFCALLMTVYTVFFFVQFFFNFDRPGPVNAQNFFRYSSSANHSKEWGSFAKKARCPSSTRTIRLSKRFHQENIPPCDVLCVDAPEPYDIREPIGLYRESFVPSVTPVHRLVRGPPSMA
jgi:hypothetical protein